MNYTEDYHQRLRDVLESATFLAIEICRAWHNENFGEPGWGGVDWVASELARAETAARIVLDKLENNGIV